jgi:hypothetical protein
MVISNVLPRTAINSCLLIVALTIVGCASGPAFKKIDDVPADKGLIYVYRPSAMHGAALVPYVVINNLNAIPLKRGGYYPYFSVPGTVTISITHTAKRSITIDVKAGKTYYVKGGTVFGAFGIPYIESVSAEVGLAEISECKRLPDIPGV